MPSQPTQFRALDAWIDAHFDAQVRFLQELVRVPTDTPPGDNAPHAERTAVLLAELGLAAERHAVPAATVAAAGLSSITNLIVRQRFGAGPVLALNAHGDVVPPGEGWRLPPYGAVLEDGRLYGRAAAVSKSDFATYTFALLALVALDVPLAGALELHFTYDEEFGGALGPGWLLAHGLTRPDWVIAAGFSYQVVNAHNGCLQMEVDVEGRMAHAAIPASGIDALQGAVTVLNALYQHNAVLRTRHSNVPGIDHPYLNVGWIEGGTNTNVVPGRIKFRLDRRMIPEEDPALVETALLELIAQAAASYPGIRVTTRRLLLAQPLRVQAASGPLAAMVQQHAQQLFGEPVPIVGSPLYTDARLYAAAGAATVLYGAGPRTVLESNAKRADEHLVLDDLRRATKVVARVAYQLLGGQGA